VAIPLEDPDEGHRMDQLEVNHDRMDQASRVMADVGIEANSHEA
jgi:hypothetical protein